MQGASVVLACRRMLVNDGFPPEILDPLLKAINQARDKNGPAQFFYEAGHDAGLSEEQILTRAAPLFMMFAAINLMDDIQDGDCDYLPANIAPAVQMTLALRAAGYFAGHIPEAVPLGLLTALTAGQVLQESSKPYLEVAKLIASAQYEAYMLVLWEGTRFEGVIAQTVGAAVGFVGHVEADMASRDPRLVGLSPDEQAPILAKARELVGYLRSLQLPCLDKFLASIKTLPEAGCRNAAPPGP